MKWTPATIFPSRGNYILRHKVTGTARTVQYSDVGWHTDYSPDDLEYLDETPSTERTFSLREMEKCWDAGDAHRYHVENKYESGTWAKHKKQYFKETFGIEI